MMKSCCSAACNGRIWRASSPFSSSGWRRCWPSAISGSTSTNRPGTGSEAGYDPVYGARPLKRVIQRNLQNPLAGLILEGAVKDGDTVKITGSEAGLVIGGHLAEAV